MWYRKGSTGHISEVPQAGGAALHLLPPGPALGGQNWSSQTSPHALPSVEPSLGPLGMSTCSDSVSPLRQRGKLASLGDNTRGGAPPSLPAPGLAGYLGHSPEEAVLALGWAPGGCRVSWVRGPLLGWEEKVARTMTPEEPRAGNGPVCSAALLVKMRGEEGLTTPSSGVDG